VPTAVWNLSDTLPLALKGALAIGVHLLGVAGCLMPFARRARAVATLAVVVAIVGVLRQVFIGSDAIGSALSLAGWIVWLWWLAAIAHNTRREDARTMGVALATALSLQVGMQAAWHGLDLPMVRGPVAIACAFVINAAFTASGRAFVRPLSDAMTPASTRAFIALGVVLFLELTLLANVGRVGAMTQLGLIASTLLIQIGLIAGALLSWAARSKAAHIAALTAVLLVTFGAPRLHGAMAGVLVLAQVAVVMLLTASSVHARVSAARAFALGTIALFVFVFLFYNWYELPALWLAAAVMLALCALPLHEPQMLPRRLSVLPACGILLLAAGLQGTGTTVAQRNASSIRVLSYNIHQGFDSFGTPAMQSIADEIAVQNADVIALQEAGRGWTFVGGADLIAYLRYRFPDYRVHFVPVNGQLWGVALMTRLPIDSLAGTSFNAAPHTFRYGYAAATLTSGRTSTRVVSVHLTAGLEGNGADGRIDQIEQLVRTLALHDNVIIAGDLNTHPDEPPMQRLAAAGYIDAGNAAGIADRATWPAHRANERIDYVFTRGAVKAVSGVVTKTNASDHLPVLVEIETERRP